MKSLVLKKEYSLSDIIHFGFKKLSLKGISSDKTKNPVIKMLVEEREGGLSQNSLIKPEDEWLCFPD